MEKVRVKTRFKDLPGLSKKTRGKAAVILDCRGDEDQGYEYWVEVGKFPTLRMWTPAEFLDL
ncbi:hypothetical protein JOC94_004210 [Bacillus thermophilus]|uniref:Uncharacterized protein n=1 Tax=Siminovitchia thermophila TaxID=1245522 RepID=A0ABS2RCS9_9BACI|nr:hypothetical protein [Siminovitchia thermophila]MBM7717185.1 hypothetical protein [Siminovitchia thermophila]